MHDDFQTDWAGIAYIRTPKPTENEQVIVGKDINCCDSHCFGTIFPLCVYAESFVLLSLK